MTSTLPGTSSHLIVRALKINALTIDIEFRCGPCKLVAPTFEGLAEKHHAKADFVKCDVDKAQDVAQRYSVTAMYVLYSPLPVFLLTLKINRPRPTFIYLRNGVEAEQKTRGANGPCVVPSSSVCPLSDTDVILQRKGKLHRRYRSSSLAHQVQAHLLGKDRRLAERRWRLKVPPAHSISRLKRRSLSVLLLLMLCYGIFHDVADSAMQILIDIYCTFIMGINAMSEESALSIRYISTTQQDRHAK